MASTFRVFALSISAAAVIGASTLVLSATGAKAGDDSWTGFSCGQLWYARNEYFADAGFCFKTQRAISVFGRRCYAPYGKLSRHQRKQVRRIRRQERRQGC